MKTPRIAAMAATLVPAATVFVPGSAHAAPNCGAVVTANTTVTANLTDCPGSASASATTASTTSPSATAR